MEEKIKTFVIWMFATIMSVVYVVVESLFSSPLLTCFVGLLIMFGAVTLGCMLGKLDFLRQYTKSVKPYGFIHENSGERKIN